MPGALLWQPFQVTARYLMLVIGLFELLFTTPSVQPSQVCSREHNVQRIHSLVLSQTRRDLVRSAAYMLRDVVSK